MAWRGRSPSVGHMRLNSSTGPTQAEASSALSKQLMQGQLLDDIVRQHARSVAIIAAVVCQSRACCMTTTQAGSLKSIQKHSPCGFGSTAGCSGIWLASKHSGRTSPPPSQRPTLSACACSTCMSRQRALSLPAWTLRWRQVTCWLSVWRSSASC